MTFLRLLTVLVMVPFFATMAVAQDKIEATMGDDGLHKQEWFAFSFLNLPEDLDEANAEGKRLVIIWEQKGCPYCKDMHEKVLSDPKVNAYIRENFHVIQMNLWGDKEVTDFDGSMTTEKAFARKYNVQFTPTVQFFPESLEEITGKDTLDREVFRLPGFFRVFHFTAAFEFVKEKIYLEEPNFQRYILSKANQ